MRRARPGAVAVRMERKPRGKDKQRPFKTLTTCTYNLRSLHISVQSWTSCPCFRFSLLMRLRNELQSAQRWTSDAFCLLLALAITTILSWGKNLYDDLSATCRGGPTYIPKPLDTAISPYRNAHGHNRAQCDGVKALCPVALGCIPNTHSNSMGPGAIAGGTSCTQPNPRWNRCWIPSRAWCHRWSQVPQGTQAPRSGPPRPARRRRRHQWPPWLRLRQSHPGPKAF